MAFNIFKSPAEKELDDVMESTEFKEDKKIYNTANANDKPVYAARISTRLNDIKGKYGLSNEYLTNYLRKKDMVVFGGFEYSSQPPPAPPPTAKSQDPIGKFLASDEAKTIASYIDAAVSSGKMSEEGEGVINRFINGLGVRYNQEEADALFLGFQGKYNEQLGKLGYGTLLINGKARLLHENSIVKSTAPTAPDPNAASQTAIPNTTAPIPSNSTADQKANSAPTNNSASDTTTYATSPVAANTTAQPAVLPKTEDSKQRGTLTNNGHFESCCKRSIRFRKCCI